MILIVRIQPEIVDSRNVSRLQQCFSPGVIELEPTEDGRKKAVVVNARSAFC
jgi:hypothetical protein